MLCMWRTVLLGTGAYLRRPRSNKQCPMPPLLPTTLWLLCIYLYTLQQHFALVIYYCGAQRQNVRSSLGIIGYTVWTCRGVVYAQGLASHIIRFVFPPEFRRRKCGAKRFCCVAVSSHKNTHTHISIILLLLPHVHEHTFYTAYCEDRSNNKGSTDKCQQVSNSIYIVLWAKNGKTL